MGVFTAHGLYKPDALEGGAAGLLNANWDLLDGAVGAITGSAGGVSAVNYVMYVTAGTTKALNASTGVEDFSNSDSAAVLQSVLNALTTSGGSVTLKAGQSYTWNSIPTLPPNTTKWIKIYGEGVLITLTSSGRRFLDLGRLAANDTFNFFWIEGFTIDASVTSGLTGKNHVVVGNYQNNTTLSGQDVNFDHWVIRNIRTLGVRTTATATAQNFNIWLAIHATGAATQYTITNMLIERCEFNGGAYGAAMYGTHQSGFTGDPNIWMDNIVVRDIYHDCGPTVTAFDNYANVHLGSHATGGRCWVSNVIGKNSCDVGIEIDNFQQAFVRDCHLENWFGFGLAITNYLAPADVNSQTYFFDGISARRDTAAWASSATALFGMVPSNSFPVAVTAAALQSGTTYRFTTSIANAAVVGRQAVLAGFTPSGYNGTWLITNVVSSTQFDAVLATNPAAVSVFGTAAVAQPFGRVIGHNVKYYRKGSNLDNGSIAGDLVELKLPMIEFSLNNAVYYSEGSSHTTGSFTYRVIYSTPVAKPDGSPTKITIRDVDVRVTGTWGVGSSELDTTPLYLSGVVDFFVDNFNVNMDITNAASLSERAADIGQAGSATCSGTIRRLSMTATGSPRGITIYDAATKLTIPANSDIRIEDCDFSGMASGTEIAYLDTTNKLKTYVRGIKWRTFPKAQYAITAPASTVAAQYSDTWNGIVFLHGGVVSLVEVSRDNSNWWTIGTATNLCFPIYHGDWYRITYSSIPAMHLTPEP